MSNDTKLTTCFFISFAMQMYVTPIPVVHTAAVCRFVRAISFVYVTQDGKPRIVMQVRDSHVLSPHGFTWVSRGRQIGFKYRITRGPRGLQMGAKCPSTWDSYGPQAGF